MNASPAATTADVGLRHSTAGRRGARRRRDLERASTSTIRQALVDKYNAQYPGRPTRRCSATAPQRQLARPQLSARATGAGSSSCSTRILLMPADATMLDARDAMLAADRMRFGGANQTELWARVRPARHRRAARSTQRRRQRPPADPGLRVAARHRRDGDVHGDAADGPTPNAAGPVERDGLRRRLRGARLAGRRHRSGDRPARANLDDVATFAPGTYEFVADGARLRPRALHADVRRRPAQTSRSASRSTSRPGERGAPAASQRAAADAEPDDQCGLIDDTEASAWKAVGDPLTPAERRRARRRSTWPAGADVQPRPGQRGRRSRGRRGRQVHRLRQFEIWTCSANCEIAGVVNDAAFVQAVHESAADAFPGDPPWPVVPQAQIRSFTIPSADGDARTAAGR